MIRNATIAGAVLVAMAGCIPSVATLGPTKVNPTGETAIRGPYVPAGTYFAVRVNQLVDTTRTLPGTPVTAQVLQPLRSPDGQLVVPAGATMHGYVASTGSVTTPFLRFAFNSVDTTRGPAPIRLAIKSAQKEKYPGPLIYEPYYYDDWWGGPGWDPFWGSIGGGPYGLGYAPYQPSEVQLPIGAEMEVYLTAPLVPPGSFIPS